MDQVIGRIDAGKRLVECVRFKGVRFAEFQALPAAPFQYLDIA